MGSGAADVEPQQGNNSQILSELATPTRLRTEKRRLRKNKLTQSTCQGNDAEEMSPAEEHRQGSSHTEFRGSGVQIAPRLLGWGCLGGGIRQGSPHPTVLGRRKPRECDSMEHDAATRQPQHRQHKMSDSDRNPRQKEYRKKRKAYKRIRRISRRRREHRNKVIFKNQLKCISALWQTTSLVCSGFFSS